MPAKFKPSERVINRVRGQRMNTHSPAKVWKHHDMKCQSKELLFDTINSSRTKPKHRVKFRNELARRGIKTVWQMEDGTQIERTKQALLDYARENGGRFV